MGAEAGTCFSNWPTSHGLAANKRLTLLPDQWSLLDRDRTSLADNDGQLAIQCVVFL
jgi:hypothetical protein